MDGDSVNVGVVDEPDDLVGEQLAVVLRVEVGLRRLGAVQLQALAHALAQHVQRRVGLHDLGHRLDDEHLAAREPVAKRAVQVVRQVDGDHDSGGGGVDRHVVRRVVQELGAGVALNVVAVVVAPAQLHVQPVFVARLLVEQVLRLRHQAGLGHLPLEGGKQQNVCT